MSYEAYKVIHIICALGFFSFVAWAAFGGSKVAKILAHTLLLGIFVGGFGLMKNLGIAHAGPWPQWLQVKMAIWLVAGILGILIAARMRSLAAMIFPLMIVAAGMAVWSAVFKPSF